MIRPAVTADTQAVMAVVEAAYTHYIARIGKRPGPMDDDYAARIAAGQTWVLDRDGMIAGILVLEETADGFLLDNIAVRPEFHGQGLGRILIAFTEAEAKRRGFTAIRTKTFYAFVSAVPADVIKARHRRIEEALNSPWVTHY